MGSMVCWFCCSLIGAMRHFLGIPRWMPEGTTKKSSEGTADGYGQIPPPLARFDWTFSFDPKRGIGPKQIAFLREGVENYGNAFG